MCSNCVFQTAPEMVKILHSHPNTFVETLTASLAPFNVGLYDGIDTIAIDNIIGSLEKCANYFQYMSGSVGNISIQI